MAKGKKEYSFKKCTVNVDEDQIIEHKGEGIQIHSLSKYPKRGYKGDEKISRIGVGETPEGDY